MWRGVASNALTFLIVALFLLGGVILWGKAEYVAEGPLDQAICLRVERGSTMDRVSRDLAGEGAVSSGMIFRVGADYAEKSSQLKAGSFLVTEGASMEEIVDIVTRGGASTCGTEVVWRVGVNHLTAEVRELDPTTQRFEEKAEFEPGTDEVPAAFTQVVEKADTRFRIAVAEGVTSWQVVDALGKIGVLEGEIEERPAEGSLAPNSYEVVKGDSRGGLIDRMQQAQQAILDEAWASHAGDLPYGTKEEALILASIVEKETGVPEERRQVASVFVNRLEQGMRLQTDPTVIYGITNGEGVLGRGLRQSELRRETPYNTYVISGLPPTPIANPGQASIEAAVNPADSDFVFFVAKTLDSRDGHVFAETLEEHNRNVAKLRQLEAERPAEGAGGGGN